MKTIRELVSGGLRFGWRLTLWLALAGSLTGCLVIPLNRNTGNARTNVQASSLNQFLPGQTTRAEVILILGEPDAVSSDERQLAYRSEKEVALWLLVGGGYGGGAAGGSVFKNHFWVFEFDTQGRLQSIKESGRLGLVEGDRDITLNSPRKLFGSRDSPSLISGEVFLLDFPKCYWLAGVDGYRTKSSSPPVGRFGRLACTDSKLVFFTDAQFGNTRPDLELVLSSVSEARLAKFVLGRRLAVGMDDGEVHSFEIHKGLGQDTPAMRTVCDFIRSRAGAAAESSAPQAQRR